MPQADGSIIIDTRINNKDAEAQLKALQAKAKSTAQQISALDKELTAATGKRSKLADDLAAAKQQAEATARALDEVNAQLDEARTKNLAAVQKEFPGMSAATAASIAGSRTKGQYASVYAQSDKLASDYAQQQAAIGKLNAEYAQQGQVVAGLTQQRAGLAQQLEQETSAFTRSASALSLMNRAADAAKAFGASLRQAFSVVAALGKRALQSVGGIASRIKAATAGMRRFGRRIAEIAAGALFFNLISAGLRNVTVYMGNALTASGALRTALGNLAGAAQTAAAPLIQVLTPALAALANAAATVMSYIAQLVAFLTGTTVSAASSAAAGIAAVGSAASGTAADVKKATRSLAGFDEITRLDAPQSDASGGGGGGSTAITPNFGFTGQSPFLDSLLDAIKAGQWFQVGRLIGEKLRDSLNAIPWPDIQAKAVQWASNIATTINGAVTTPGMWEAIGHTIAQGLNTATSFVDTFFQGVWWADIGAGLARGLTQLVAEVDWPQLGRALTDGMRAALLVLHGFVTTYTGWTDLGMSIAAMIGAALSNIDWVQAAGDLSALAIGILTTVNTSLAQVDWGSVGQTVVDMLAAVDWLGLLSQLGQLLANTWPLVLTTVVLPAILTWIGGTLLTALSQAIVTSLATWFSTVAIPAVLSGIGSALSAIVAAIGGWPVVLIAAVVAVFAAVVAVVVANWDELCAWFSGAWDSFVAGWNEFWSSVAANARNWWSSVTSDWAAFWNGLVSRFNALKGSMSNAWTSFWSGLASGVASIWNGIVNTVKGAINSLISLINGMLSSICRGINGAIDILNGLSIDVPSWAQGAFGSKIGFNVSHISAPRIPYLAQGAVIPPNREFLAVLGDQRSGTNVEAPLATIQQAVAAVMQDNLDGELAALEQVEKTLRQILEAVYGIHIGDDTIGRAAARYRQRQAGMTGETMW